MQDKILVTLDGPAGVGKTTLAKRVAAYLNIAYLDTGAMFRALAWNLGAGSWENEQAVSEKLSDIDFCLRGSGPGSELFLNGKSIGPEIRTEEVGFWASQLAKLSVVRDKLKLAQQTIGLKSSLVAEGRDMGTVVFPQAEYKFFLDAAPEVRGRRRWLQLQAMGVKEDLPKLIEQIQVRDAQDRNRIVAPLRPAEDAVIIDTGELDVAGVFEEIRQKIENER